MNEELTKEKNIMNLLSFPATDSFAETIETFSEDAYIFCAPETVD